MVDKYLFNNAGALTERPGTVTSTGAPDAGKIIALNDTGLIDMSLMPVGIGADVQIVVASEALLAGDLLNLWNDGGTVKARKADASTPGKEAQGFTLSPAVLGGDVMVYFEGNNTQLSGLAAGTKQFLSDTVPGRPQSAAPTGTGVVVQVVGFATSTTSMNFQSRSPIVLA